MILRTLLLFRIMTQNPCRAMATKRSAEGAPDDEDREAKRLRRLGELLAEYGADANMIEPVDVVIAGGLQRCGGMDVNGVNVPSRGPPPGFRVGRLRHRPLMAWSQQLRALLRRLK